MSRDTPTDHEGTPLGNVLDFMRVLWAVDHALAAASKAMLRTVGVTGPQRLALRVVGRFPGVGAGRLAEILHLHPSTLTGILRRLEDRSLLVRSADSTDARRVTFQLSPLGRRIDRTQAGTAEAAIRRAIFSASGSDLGATRTVLSAVVAELAGVAVPGTRKGSAPRKEKSKAETRAPARAQARAR